jgi:hypothetical protein
MCIWVELQVLKIWDLGSILKSGRLSLANPSQQHGKPTRVSLVKFGCREAKMDPFAAASLTPWPLKYVAVSSHLINHTANNVIYVICKELNLFISTG